MRWKRGHRSANVEDHRGSSGRRRGGLPIGRRGGMGLGGLIMIFLLSVIFKQDFFSLLGGASGGVTSSAPSASAPATTSPEEQERFEFVSFVFDDVQETWTKIFPQMQKSYGPSKMVVFRDAISSACGFAQSATGPFYCPADEKVYLDLSFFDELSRRFGAPGDFAQAYVIAHEVGHHVQQELGIDRQVRNMQNQRRDQANQLSVRMELQADCLAGVWAFTTAQRDLLERGDIQEGMGAAAAVGDDRIQKRSTGRVSPESFTHGTAKQRQEWFQRGYKTGDPNECDTFAS